MPFSAAQTNALAAPLDPERLETRRLQGRDIAYLEGGDVIETANTIFGYGEWGYSVTRLEQVGHCWLATVLLHVAMADGTSVSREDVGFGIPATPRDAKEPTPEAVETAVKSSVTDGLKRALRTFGDQFGLGLYGRDGDDAKPQPAQRPQAPAAARPAPAPAPVPTLSPERANKLRGLILHQITQQGADDVYAAKWLEGTLANHGRAALTELTEAEGRALLERAARADITRPADGGAR